MVYFEKQCAIEKKSYKNHYLHTEVVVLATLVIKCQIWLIAKPVGTNLEIKVRQLEEGRTAKYKQ